MMNYNHIKHKNCLISAVGKSSLHKSWIKEMCNFDIHLIVYDNSLYMFQEDADFICHIKGYKLKIIYKYLIDNPYLIEAYDFFFFPDDDIMMDSTTINTLFDTMCHYNLKIAQPALRMSYYSWPHTLYDRYCDLRYTNFIEMMVPCFSKVALQKVLFTFNENKTGWGTEFHWSLLINATPCDMAIIDKVSVVHTRPIQSGQNIHKKDCAAYLRKFGLTAKVDCYNVMPTHSEYRYCCDKATFIAVRNMLLQLLNKEKISSLYIGEDGYLGYVHLLFLIANITQSQKYADAALELFEHIQDGLPNVKDDMSFMHGITGCCWLIEYLARENLLREDPQEILTEVDKYIQQYAKSNTRSLSIVELAGIGRYYHAKFRNRPDLRNKEALHSIGKRMNAQFMQPQSFHDIRIALDALEILNECGTDICSPARSLERLIPQIGLSQVEHVYCLFRLYTITHDEHLHIFVRERMKNLVPQLMNLPDALMLAEILYYKH